MISTLKKISSLEKHPSPLLTGYGFKKYYHPDSGKKPEEFGDIVQSLEQAQEFCNRPESSFKEGDSEHWWFIGYYETSSRTSRITLW